MSDTSDILSQLKNMLHEAFEIHPDHISENSHLYRDLELDSIDAIDLVVKLQDLTGLKISSQEFKSVETISDVIEHIHRFKETTLSNT
jgi:acyl carrier protein